MVSDELAALGVLFVCGLVLYLSTRFQPHWVAKDGSRMITTGRRFDVHGRPAGRPFDARVFFRADRVVTVRRRLSSRESEWTVAGRSPDPPRRREVFVLRPLGRGDDEMLTLTVPASSRAVALLERYATISP